MIQKNFNNISLPVGKFSWSWKFSNQTTNILISGPTISAGWRPDFLMRTGGSCKFVGLSTFNLSESSARSNDKVLGLLNEISDDDRSAVLWVNDGDLSEKHVQYTVTVLTFVNKQKTECCLFCILNHTCRWTLIAPSTL